MCTSACMEFAETQLTSADVANRSVLEVGALNINGSVRACIEARAPLTYLGVDLVDGPGVDEICDIYDLVLRFGEDRFDLVVCTEVIEHVLDWRLAISNLKNVLKPYGNLVLTTRSRGFHLHGYPHDFWRYEVDDMRSLFGDLSIHALQTDHCAPGVLLKAQKTVPFAERELDDYQLFSVISDRRIKNVKEFDIRVFEARRSMRPSLSLLAPAGVAVRPLLSRVLPTGVKAAIKDLVLNK